VSLDEKLFEAAQRGDAAKVEELLKKGADVNARNWAGVTPLHIAAANGYLEVVKLLLEHGADANAREEDGLSPLHIAAANGYLEVVKLLLEHGADPAIRNNRGWTPLDVARTSGREEVVKVLKEFSEQKGEVIVESGRAAAPSILGVDCSELYVGGWGRLVVRVRGSGAASVSLVGEVEWINPGVVELSGESVVEIPVKPRVGGEVPVKVSVASYGLKTSKIVWLKVAGRAGKCSNCGAPIEPGAKYCWRCGAKLG
jgi:hypothetical protein